MGKRESTVTIPHHLRRSLLSKSCVRVVVIIITNRHFPPAGRFLRIAMHSGMADEPLVAGEFAIGVVSGKHFFQYLSPSTRFSGDFPTFLPFFTLAPCPYASSASGAEHLYSVAGSAR